MGTSCSDVCDWVLYELQILGFKWDDDDDSHDDILELLTEVKLVRRN